MKLTDAVVKKLPVPEKGNKITYDDDCGGFGVRVTYNGARSFILTYWNSRRIQRRMTIGSAKDWTVAAARKEASRLRKLIDDGKDPLAEERGLREASTVSDLAERALKEHWSRKAPDYATDNARIVRDYIVPKLGKTKVAHVTYADVCDLHHKVTDKGGKYRANRTLAALRKMMNLAIKWGYRSDNPCFGVEMHPEEKRERFLKGDELERLSSVLMNFEDKRAANAIWLLLLTGARSGEVLSAKWDQFDLKAGVWTKPATNTKQQRKLHRVPLSTSAMELLWRMERNRSDSEFLFPGRDGDRVEDLLKRPWQQIRKQAKLGDLRIHDLRHTFASVLASRGLSLPIIGGPLGHSNAATTHRYAHLLDDALRDATNEAALVITRR